MEQQFDRAVQERAVLVGLNADCFTQEQTANDETLRELEELLGLRDEEQRRMDREDEEVFRLVHGPKVPLSEGCVHVVLR